MCLILNGFSSWIAVGLGEVWCSDILLSGHIFDNVDIGKQNVGIEKQEEVRS